MSIGAAFFGSHRLVVVQVGGHGANGSHGDVDADGKSIARSFTWNFFGLAQYGYTSDETCDSASGSSNGGYGEASYCY